MPGAGRVEWIDVPEPRLASADAVVLRMLRGGLCATDRKIVQGRHPLGAPEEGSERLILGHESLGEVVEAGENAAGLRVGDLAAIAPRRPCAPPCAQCRRGRSDLCASGEYTEMGIVGRDGMLCDYVGSEARYVFAVPPELGGLGVLMEPASVVEKAWRRAAQAREALFGETLSRRALVLGAGPIGMLAALLGRLRGSEVATVSLEPADSERARRLRAIGVDYARADEFDAAGFDTILDCTGSPTAVFDHLGRAAFNAVIVLAGGCAPGRRREPIDVGGFLIDSAVKNLVWLGTVNADADSWRAAARDLSDARLRFPGLLEGLITHRLRREQAPEAFFRPREGEIKCVIELAGK